ncbi:hypothetical protein IU459_35770 [Nocardia amamiensis]|uniref:Integrase n=1 Tax=Nocardia amamiensis TaxID=404578 RepID=A0ABS0D1X2_9NOCA|nr:hypothetical protein [Nocardia amamiensis]MBF6302845.1 hypothetical protein [Nocardia amamiensis]
MVLTVWSETGGVEGVFDFSLLPGSSELRRAFAAALDRKCGPGGTWRAYATCRAGYYAIREFLRWADCQDDPVRTVGEITPAMWSSWRLATPATANGRNCLGMVRALIPQVPGVSTDTVKAVERRMPPVVAPQEASYSYAEFTEIRTRAAATFNNALVRIRTNREHLRRWRDGEFEPDSSEWLVGDALDQVLRTGDAPLMPNAKVRTIRKHYRRALGGRSPEKTWGRLYLTRTEAFAAAVLLVASGSWNHSVLDAMTVPTTNTAIADDLDIHTVEIRKPRRPVRSRYTTNNLIDHGEGSPGRLLSQVIEATDPARYTLALQGRPTDRLLVCRLNRGWRDGSAFQLGIPASVHDPEIGSPACGHISLRRIRRTVQVLIRKEPAQNSRDTHESVYVMRDPATKHDAAATIAQGLTDAVEHARVIGAMRVAFGDVDALIELSDNPELAKAIGDGTLDTATAACTDFTHSPFSEPELPCTASFLLCLACPNAIATRRHLPRLVHLREALDELRGVVDSAVWSQDWHEHHLRVSALLDNHTTPEERAAALVDLSDADRATIGKLLRRRLDP